MFWIALAAEVTASQLAAPQPTNLLQWATYEDVPMEIVPEGPNWTVGFRVIVDPNGKPLDCLVMRSSRIPELDRYACKLVTHRARFIPAKDLSGVPAFGVYESNLAFWVGEKGPPPKADYVGDLDLVASSLPPGTQSPVTVRINFAVDAEGRPSSCAEEKTAKIAPAELVKLACERLQEIKFAPVKDNRGIAVPSVQDAQVRFSLKP